MRTFRFPTLSIIVCAALALFLLGSSGFGHRSAPKPPVRHKIARHVTWHHTRVIVTEYVVRQSQGCTVYTGHTATGTRTYHGTIAVDPSVFPFGTRFLIPHYGYGVARDTGGAVIGHHIDAAVYSCREALNWGAPSEVVSYR